MLGWMTLCSVLVNGAAACLFYHELHCHREKYPVRSEGKLPRAACPYSILMAAVAVGLSLFITLFYSDNTFLFTLKRAVMLAVLWPVAYTDLTAYRIPNLFVAAGLAARAAILAAEFIWERDALLYGLLTEVAAAVVLFLVLLWLFQLMMKEIMNLLANLVLKLSLFWKVEMFQKRHLQVTDYILILIS